MNPDLHFRKNFRKRLAAVTLCAAMLFQPVTSAAAAPDGSAVSVNPAHTAAFAAADAKAFATASQKNSVDTAPFAAPDEKAFATAAQENSVDTAPFAAADASAFATAARENASNTAQMRLADTEAEADNGGAIFVSLANTTYAYTGKTIKPKVSVKKGGLDVSPKKYTVTYGQTVGGTFKKKTPKAMGYYTIKITFKGAYKNQRPRTLSFSITPKAPTLTSAKTGKKDTLKVSWKKVTKASGYVIWLVPTDYGDAYRTTIGKNTGSGTFSLKDVPAGTYYVYVVAYAKVSGNGRVSSRASNSLPVPVTKAS